MPKPKKIRKTLTLNENVVAAAEVKSKRAGRSLSNFVNAVLEKMLLK